SPYDLIWAVPRNRMKNCVWPPESWDVKRVFDLNYAEDSPGKEYALDQGAEYFDGSEMFQIQASEQRKFWQPLLDQAKLAEVE
ncbi:MAG: hypothetical protein KDD22_08955, partial [Bdellovibrionales bacterium]|nr:hypothetical protein [Bdellovibrionales bacterium]